MTIACIILLTLGAIITIVASKLIRCDRRIW